MAKKPRDSESAYRAPTMDETIVDFENPPVSEVVCGIGFERPNGYSTPQMGLFWSKVRDVFPVAEVKAPLSAPGGTIEFVISDTPPAPRYFLRGVDRSELIQLQENRFLFNWLMTDEKPSYPRYKAVITRFNQLRGQFKEFLSEIGINELRIRELRLTYVNHIAKGEGWETPTDIGNIFPDFRFRRRGRDFLKAPFGWNLFFHHPVSHKKSRLEINIRSGSKPDKDGVQKEIFIAQLSVTGEVSEPSEEDTRAWFDMAREAIDRGFVDLTNPKIQKSIWRRKNRG